MAKNDPDHYGPRETRRRFEAALRGARIAEHRPMASIPRKQPKVQRRKRKSRSA